MLSGRGVKSDPRRSVGEADVEPPVARNVGRTCDEYDGANDILGMRRSECGVVIVGVIGCVSEPATRRVGRERGENRATESPVVLLK